MPLALLPSVSVERYVEVEVEVAAAPRTPREMVHPMCRRTPANFASGARADIAREHHVVVRQMHDEPGWIHPRSPSSADGTLHDSRARNMKW